MRLSRNDAAVLDALLPAGANSVLTLGIAGSGFEAFLIEFHRQSPPRLWRAFRLALWTAGWIGPLLVRRMPPIGRLLGHVDFSGLFLNLSQKSYETLASAKAAGAPTLNYGIFLNTVINFLIVAFAVFLVVQQVNRWTKKPEAAVAPATKNCPQCAMTIPIAAKRCGHCTTHLA